MNSNLFYKELKKNLAGLVIWAVVITILISVTMSVFRTFIGNQSKVMGMLSLVPKGALEFKGISNFNELLSVLGFYAVNNIIYMMVLGSIYSTVLASNILLKEEYNRTAEYLLAWPLTRSEIFLSKSAVVFLNVLLLNLVTAFAGFICIEIVKNDDFSTGSFMILTLYTFLLNILFSAIGLFLSTAVRKARPITTFSIGLVLILYFVFTLSKITEGISKIGYLSPFRYVDTEVLKSNYGLSFYNIAYFLSFTLIMYFFSFRLYARRNIYT